MRHVLLLLLISIVLTGCDDYTGQKSYDEALRCIKEGDAPQALAYLREAAQLGQRDTTPSSVLELQQRSFRLFADNLPKNAAEAIILLSMPVDQR